MLSVLRESADHHLGSTHAQIALPISSPKSSRRLNVVAFPVVSTTPSAAFTTELCSSCQPVGCCGEGPG